MSGEHVFFSSDKKTNSVLFLFFNQIDVKTVECLRFDIFALLSCGLPTVWH